MVSLCALCSRVAMLREPSLRVLVLTPDRMGANSMSTVGLSDDLRSVMVIGMTLSPSKMVIEEVSVVELSH